MAFEFALETLLRFRRSIERQCELDLYEAARQAAVIKNEIESLDRQSEAIHEYQLREMQSGIAASHLHFDLVRRKALQERRNLLEIELARREKLRRQRMQKFRQAHRDREAVGTLRQQQHQSYLRQEARREQRRLDDLFLLRREFLRRG